MAQIDKDDFSLLDVTGEDIARVGRSHDGPRWRWERAKRIAYGPLPKYLNAFDEVTLRAARWLQDSAQGVQPHAGDTAEFTSAITADNDPVTRFSLEARLLSNQPMNVIADRTGVELQTVVAFELLFFDVSERLSASAWIANHVFGSEPQEQISKRSIALQQSYHGGPEVCEQWLEHFKHIDSSTEHDLNTQMGRLRERLELICMSVRLPTNLTHRQIAAISYASRRVNVRTRSLSEIVGRSMDEPTLVALSKLLGSGSTAL